MATVHSFPDVRPPARFDGVSWTKVRIEHTLSDVDEATWTADATQELNPVDTDPGVPELRDLTLESDEPAAYFRFVFIDATSAESAPSASVLSGVTGFTPTIAQVSALLRARTYENTSEQVGEFSDKTRPTADEVTEDIIPAACQDVTNALGTVPGPFILDAQRVAALRAAAEIERSYLPEQTELGAAIYQTLRFTYDEELEVLRANMLLGVSG